LYDDREESAGVKFNDADLIGIPVRLTISRRTMQENSVEIKPRWSDEAHMVPEAEVEVAIREALAGG
ncbi:MAG TPA: His/Gly/Thr/Pro-type tRNA ligase C-terminal domain-containing protein, partial [Anaerolineae bacterium]|nr:His/Gly/Thr/Pro-type tRNA ligase C-terminal domain-containing protein [Anaerolineae bacterium]